ncbi:hypothetical protein Taro_013161 [Colocasia esculenta]|uniref:Uncharacterized protein n=1 Tax=Colocasia esculenta TaxID=4460 RepID=A0A843UHX6_COLES|nr:hypothetical protein [Colocasia esculenta]
MGVCGVVPQGSRYQYPLWVALRFYSVQVLRVVIRGVPPRLGFAPVKATALGVALLMRQLDALRSDLERAISKGRVLMATKDPVATGVSVALRFVNAACRGIAF